MEIRPIRDKSDIEGIVGIINAVYPDDPIMDHEFVSWGEQARERIDLVAERDGTIVGAARGYFESHRPNPWVHIWIPASERRRGVGSAL
ncbi:MAG: GNAT family N-acetyltransferase, partial [Actinomycetota bacterium]|nr:GNAT family N-acetyltransferase [Actinomycetota bacterium]